MIKGLVNKYKTDETFKHLFWVTVVYVLAQGFLLVVSGIWWDDWAYVNKNWDYLLEVFLQSSLPLQAYIDASLWMLPDGAYRILVFVYFYVGALLVYIIMKKIDVFSSEAAFWITLLYITIPINDARITWICYGYSLGLFSFWIAFYLVTLWRGETGRKAVRIRVLSLIVLIFSFNTESIMLMTLLILLYLYYERLKDGWKWREIEANIKKCFYTVLYYIDFLLAPIVFYFGKHMMFPGYGVYGGHNYVDWNALPGLILRSPLFAINTMKGLVLNYIDILSNHIVLTVLIGVDLFCFLAVFRRRYKRTENSLQRGKTIKLLFLGVFCFFSGFFAYVIRCQGAFETKGVNGRNALLLGIGTAMILYYLVELVCYKKIRKVILVSFIVLGVCHFNIIYLDWQEDYYQQLRFTAEIAENPNILSNDTFLCLYNNSTYENPFYQLNGNPRFYQLNGNSFIATGEETRYYLGDISSLPSLKDMNEDTWYLKGYNMRDWNYFPENQYLDGIILINNVPIDNSVLMRLKLKELFDKEAFGNWILETKDVLYIPVNKEESDAMIKASEDGVLTRDNIFNYIEAYPLK